MPTTATAAGAMHGASSYGASVNERYRRTDLPVTLPLRRRSHRPPARLPAIEAQTRYIVGGLYGNQPALDAIEAMVAHEAGPVTLVFNGDFNWFNVDDAGFAEINRRVLTHHAIVGNVEAELCVDGNAAGCGCAYPEHVDSAIVERSKRIHARLKETASRHSALLERLAALPMIAPASWLAQVV